MTQQLKNSQLEVETDYTDQDEIYFYDNSDRLELQD
jgi:hypothetical protein